MAVAFAAAIAALVPLLTSSEFHLHLAIVMCLNLLAVNGLFIISRSGQLSLCHAAFMGLSAYVCAIAGKMLGLPFLAACSLGVVSGVALAFLLGKVVLRLKGVYFVLITFVFGEIFRLLVLEAEHFTGGASGITGIQPARIFGLLLDSKPAFFYAALILAAGSASLAVWLFQTATGQAINSVGDNPDLAEATGISVRKVQLFCFTLGSSMASLSGAFMASYTGYISPESFNMNASILLLLMMVIGGRKSIIGPLVGTLFITLLPEFLRGAVKTQNMFYGIVLIVILRFLPDGLASFRQRLRAQRDGNRKSHG